MRPCGVAEPLVPLPRVLRHRCVAAGCTLPVVGCFLRLALLLAIRPPATWSARPHGKRAAQPGEEPSAGQTWLAARPPLPQRPRGECTSWHWRRCQGRCQPRWQSACRRADEALIVKSTPSVCCIPTECIHPPAACRRSTSIAAPRGSSPCPGSWPSRCRRYQWHRRQGRWFCLSRSSQKSACRVSARSTLQDVLQLVPQLARLLAH